MPLHVCETPALFGGSPYWYSQCFCGVQIVSQDPELLRLAIGVHETTGYLVLDLPPSPRVDEVSG